MIYVLSVTINPNHSSICSITAHVLNSFGLNLNYIVPYFESTNSSLLIENVLFGIWTKNAYPSLQLLNYFIIIGKLYLWDCRSKQILPNIYGFRAKIIAKYETEEKISNKEFFKRKWILTPYLS